MSEDVKPRQWTLVFDNDEEIGHIMTLANYSKKNRHEEHVNVIELEPTLQLMEEMGNKLSEVENYLHLMKFAYMDKAIDAVCKELGL